MPDRIQREVEELLAKLDTFPPRRSLRTRVRNSVSRGVQRLRSIRLPNLSAGHILLIAIGIIVVGYLVAGGSDLGRWLIVAGVVVFIAAFIFSLRRQSRPSEKYWRDRPMELRRPSGPRGRPWWDRWRNR